MAGVEGEYVVLETVGSAGSSVTICTCVRIVVETAEEATQ